jgi:hypothetical protein
MCVRAYAPTTMSNASTVRNCAWYAEPWSEQDLHMAGALPGATSISLASNKKKRKKKKKTQMKKKQKKKKKKKIKKSNSRGLP